MKPFFRRRCSDGFQNSAHIMLVEMRALPLLAGRQVWISRPRDHCAVGGRSTLQTRTVSSEPARVAKEGGRDRNGAPCRHCAADRAIGGEGDRDANAANAYRETRTGKYTKRTLDEKHDAAPSIWFSVRLRCHQRQHWLSLICEWRVDLIAPTPTRSLIRGCMRPGDCLPLVKFKRMERPLFTSIQTLEKRSRSAKKCKKSGRSNRV